MFGLFGKPRTVQDVAKPYTDRIDAAANVPEMRQQAAQAPRQDDFRINPTLAAIGQIFSGMAGRSNPVFEMLMTQRLQQQRAQQQAEQAAAQRAGQREDFMFEHDYKRAHPLASDAQPYRFEDNAGNVWERQADGTNKLIFTDLAPKQYFANGGIVNVPNPYAPQGGMRELPPGFQVQGGPAPGAPGGFPR